MPHQFPSHTTPDHGSRATVRHPSTRATGAPRLGATPRTLLTGVMRPGTLLVAAGVLLGLSAAVGSARVLSAFLYDVGAHDPWTFAAAALLLGTIGVSATLLPAQRAGRVDPTLVLRE